MTDLEVHMDPCRTIHTTGIPHPSDHLAARNVISRFDIMLLVVRIERDEIIAMIDLDDIAISPIPPIVGAYDDPVFRGKYCAPSFRLDIDRVVARTVVLRIETIIAGLLENTHTRNSIHRRRRNSFGSLLANRGRLFRRLRG